MFETIAAGVLVQKASGEIVFANKVAQEILTYPMDELAEKTSEDPDWHMVMEDGSFVPGEEHPSMVTARTGKPLRNEVRGLFANSPNKVRWLSINTEPIFSDDSGKPTEVVVTFIDITAQKQAEKAIEEGKEFYKRLIENQNDLVVEIDTENRVLYASPSYCETFGVTAEEIAGTTFMPFVAEEDRETVQASLASLANPPHKTLHVERARTIHGWRILQWSACATVEEGKIATIISCGRDITEQQMSESRFSQLFETIGSCVAVYEPINDGEDFRIVDMNPAGLKSSNVNKADIIGKRVTEVFPGVSEMGLFEVFQRVHKTGKTDYLPLTLYEDDRVEGYVENTVYRLTNGQIVAVYDDTSERRFAEIALRESEERYRILYESAQDAIFLADADTGMMIDCNPKAEKLIGYSREEIKNLHQTDLHPPDDRDRYNRQFNKATKDSSSHFHEVFVTHKDGRKIPVEISAGSTACIGGRNIHIGIFRDISQRLKVQKELEETLEATTEAIWTWNLVNNEVTFSSRYYTMLGYEPDELTEDYDNWLELIHPDDREESLSKVQRFLNSNPRPDTFENEFRLHTKTGEYRYIRSLGKVVERDKFGQATRMIGNHRDVTERIKHELQYSRMLQASVDGFWYTSVEGTLLEVNTSAAEMLGYTVEELRGKNVRDLEATESPEESAKHIEKIKEEGSDKFESRHYKKDGSIIDVEVSAAFLPATNDNFVVFVRDISEQKEAERERAKLEAQLRQSQKMEAIGRLAGGIAHDFNNLLTTIIGNISLAKMDNEPSSELMETLEEIDEAAERGAGLTRQLLAFSRKQVISPRIIEPNDLLKNLQKLLGRVLGEDIETRWIFEGNKCVEADVSQMEQVIVNLAVNARDAMPKGGAVTFATKSRSIDGCDYVAFIVSDNGPGMDEETQSRIFEPFFTTKSSEIGTGLGLATVFGIVQQHDGWIDVVSEPGKGTTFSVYLKAVNERIVSSEKNDGVANTSEQQKVILVVEDDAPVRNIAMRILEREGYEAYCAESGPAAIEFVKEKELIVDLLLTDIVMPQMNGKQLADIMCKMQPEMKVLFISGYTEDVIGQHGVLKPGTNFLSKPYRPKSLLKKLKEILD